jgi:hypothetical protein
MRKNNVQCGFKKLWILAILLGSRNGFQNASGRNLGSCLWIDGFGKALKPLPVVKTMQMENL